MGGVPVWVSRSIGIQNLSPRLKRVLPKPNFLFQTAFSYPVPTLTDRGEPHSLRESSLNTLDSCLRGKMEEGYVWGSFGEGSAVRVVPTKFVLLLPGPDREIRDLECLSVPYFALVSRTKLRDKVAVVPETGTSPERGEPSVTSPHRTPVEKSFTLTCLDGPRDPCPHLPLPQMDTECPDRPPRVPNGKLVSVHGPVRPGTRGSFLLCPFRGG